MPQRHLIRLLPIAALLSAAALASGCGSSSSKKSSPTTTPAPSAPAATTPAKTQAAAGGAISIQADPSGALAYVQKSVKAKAGHVTISFTNTAPVPHNLTLASSAGKAIGATPTFSGGSKKLAVTLAPGSYTYYCTVPGHRQAGMQGTLVVS